MIDVPIGVSVLIVGLAAVTVWGALSAYQMKQEGLNYRCEMRERANAPQPVQQEGNDWLMQLASFAMSPQGQQIIETLSSRLGKKE